MTYFAWLVFLGAAVLEVGGDAVVRKGLRGGLSAPICEISLVGPLLSQDSITDTPAIPHVAG